MLHTLDFVGNLNINLHSQVHAGLEVGVLLIIQPTGMIVLCGEHKALKVLF